MNVETESVNTPSKPGTLDRDYIRTWVDSQGRDYRFGVFEKQRKGGLKPLVANPTVAEIRQALAVYNPGAILEVGCGWGRLLEELHCDFDIAGCDVSDDMLALADPRLKTFKLDIATENIPFMRANAQRWDVLFTRGVMMYLMDVPVHIAYAINNMLMLAAKKIIIWEWPEVCEKMRQFSSSPKFEYRPIEHRSE
jgi:trans-aconitate methyltransferase